MHRRQLHDITGAFPPDAPQLSSTRPSTPAGHGDVIIMASFLLCLSMLLL